MIRTIVGFHQDEEGDWVAELSCLHNQHVRHQPPFFERPWVHVPSERAAAVPIPPGVPHAISIEGPVRLAVDFLTRDENS